MSSTSIYSDKKYVVYHTTYSGDKFPPNYIGSTSLENINNGYKGSVSSKQYKHLWDDEIKVNPHLFSVVIISYHDTRPAAIYKELQLQKIFNVVTNKLFVNKSYAKPNGFFGMDTSGKNNGNYGKRNKGALGLIMITNGEHNRFIKRDDEIPVNWWKGSKCKKPPKIKPIKVPKIKPIKIPKPNFMFNQKGDNNPAKIPFVSIIATRKTYGKNNASRYLTDLKQFF